MEKSNQFSGGADFINPPRWKAVLFDFDGTIADSFDCAIHLLNSMAPKFGYRQLEEHELERARGMSSSDFVRFLKIPWLKISRVVKEGRRQMFDHMGSIQPIEGIATALPEIQKRIGKIGILTSNSEQNVKRFLELHGLESCFDFVTAVSKVEGKARAMKKTLSRLNLSAADVLYVGDERRDLKACRKAGLRCAAVTWGYNTGDSLRAEQPDYLLSTPSELLEIC